jgi:CheY-like chemotaxis protein
MAMRFRVLIIEDDRTMIKSLKLTLKDRLIDVKVSSTGFRKAKEKVATERPDAVVMDVFEDQTKTTTKADATWDYIWDVHFCPVVVHSAREEPAFLRGKRHPFAHYEPKSQDSQERVADKLKTYRSHIDGLRAFGDEVAKKAAESLRYVSELVWKEPATDSEKRDLLLRVTRRRVAASFDLPPTDGHRTRAWEQYIYPPLDPDILTGDVLREAAGQANEPCAFRVVLSPSCDLVVSQGALEKVLVARCVEAKRWLKKLGLDAATSEAKLRDKLPREVTRDQHDGVKILPSLPGHIPLMAVDLKELELIPRNQIEAPGGAASQYVRVASVDSPFREQVAWAYVQVAGRPGMPVTDAVDFTDRIIQTVKGSKAS